jgi:CubicO group peptidase (beta-lactamase class C family)
MGHKILVTMGLILLWALAVAGAVVAEAFWLGPPAIPRGSLAAIENHLVQRLGDAAENQRLGSGALVLLQGDRIVAEHGFGIADSETRAAVKPDQTLYLLASVSKAVTSWGIMKLVQEGTLSLDEPVLPHLKRWRFPGSDAYRDRVTVRHLLSHTAGLDDGLGYGGFSPDDAIQSLEESLLLTRDSTVGEPRHRGKRAGNGHVLFRRWLHNPAALDRGGYSSAVCRLHERGSLAAVGDDQVEF